MTLLHAPPVQAPRDRPSGHPAERAIDVGVLGSSDLVTAGLRALLDPGGARLAVQEATPSAMTGHDVLLVGPVSTPLPDSCHDDLRLSIVVGIGWEVQARSVDPVLLSCARTVLPLETPALQVVRAIEEVVRLERRSTVVGAGDGVRTDSGLLSQRERDVLTLICVGLSNQEIAERLYLSINSVKSYVRLAYRKIDVTRRSQAVVWGLQHGL